jgi:hypothetical protein
MFRTLGALFLRLTGQTAPSPSNVICEGNGRVGTTVADILNSPKFQELQATEKFQLLDDIEQGKGTNIPCAEENGPEPPEAEPDPMAS